jgi:hypothetical protein
VQGIVGPMGPQGAPGPVPSTNVQYYVVTVPCNGGAVSVLGQAGKNGPAGVVPTIPLITGPASYIALTNIELDYFTSGGDTVQEVSLWTYVNGTSVTAGVLPPVPAWDGAQRWYFPTSYMGTLGPTGPTQAQYDVQLACASASGTASLNATVGISFMIWK